MNAKTETRTPATIYVELLDAPEQRAQYGITHLSAFVYRTSKSSAPTRIEVWNNANRPNPRNGEQVRFGQYGPLDGGDGRFLDPNNKATDAPVSVLLSPEASCITNNGTNTGTAASGQVYAADLIRNGDVIVLIYPDGIQRKAEVKFTNNGHGALIPIEEPDQPEELDDAVEPIQSTYDAGVIAAIGETLRTAPPAETPLLGARAVHNYPAMRAIRNAAERAGLRVRDAGDGAAYYVDSARSVATVLYVVASRGRTRIYSPDAKLTTEQAYAWIQANTGGAPERIPPRVPTDSTETRDERTSRNITRAHERLVSTRRDGDTPARRKWLARLAWWALAELGNIEYAENSTSEKWHQLGKLRYQLDEIEPTET